MTFKVSNLTNGIVEFDGVFWQPAQTRELKTVTEEMLEAAASNVLLIVEVEDGVQSYAVKSVVSPYTLSEDDDKRILVFDAENPEIHIPLGILPGLSTSFRNKQVSAISLIVEDESMSIVGAGNMTTPSLKVNSLYIEDATTIVTVGDFEEGVQ